MDALTYINLFITRVQKKLRLFYVVRNAGVFFALSALLWLIFLLVASQVNNLLALRGTAIFLSGLSCIGFTLHLHSMMRTLRQKRFLAQFIGLHLPRLASDLISTVELKDEVNRGDSRFSFALFGALAQQTWLELKRFSPTFFVPPAKLRPMITMVSVVIVAWALSAASFPSQLEMGSYKLFFANQSEEGLISAEPLIGDITLTYHYPEHMGRRERKVISSTGQLTAPKGTRISFSTVTLVPTLEAGLRLRWQGEHADGQAKGVHRIQLNVKGNQQLQGQFVVLRDGFYRFEILSTEQQILLDPLEHAIDLEPDDPPRITLFGPANDLEITSNHRLEIGYQAEDDYGLDQVRLVYQNKGGPAHHHSLWRPPPKIRIRAASGKYDWNLSQADIKPGSQITYWLEAVDNDAVSGPKISRSTTHSFRIYSAEEKYSKMLEQHQQLLEHALRVLADRLLLFEKTPDLSTDLRLQKNSSVHRNHQTLVDELRELRNRIQEDRLAPKSVLRLISRLHERMRDLMAVETTQLKNEQKNYRRRQVRATHLLSLQAHNQQMVTQLEQDVLDLANSLDEQRIQTLLSHHKKLLEARERLADLLMRYRKTRDQKLRQEILQHIKRMEQHLSQLLAEASQLQGTLPVEYVNPEAFGKVDLQSNLQQIREMIERGDLSQLESYLKNLDQKLQQVQNLLAENLDQFRSQRMSKQERAYNEMIDRLRDVEAEQRKLAQSTEQIVRRYHKRAAELMRHKINPFVQQQLAKLAQLRQKVKDIDPKLLPAYDQEQLDRVKQRLEDLRAMLDQGDLDQGLQMARRTANGLQLLKDDIADEMDGQSAWRKRQMLKAHRRTRSAHEIASEIVANLEDIFPSPRSLLKAEDFQELKRIKKLQQELHKQLMKVEGQVAKPGAEPAPDLGLFLGPETTQVFREALDLMKKGELKLRKLQPQQAHGAQEAAADQLAQIRKQMKMARQPQSWGGGGAVGPRERIKIPGVDSFHPPREFRQDLLEAMKEKPPVPYRSQVKKYYEDLVR